MRQWERDSEPSQDQIEETTIVNVTGLGYNTSYLIFLFFRLCTEMWKVVTTTNPGTLTINRKQNHYN